MSISNRVLFAVMVMGVVMKIGSAEECLNQTEFDEEYGNGAFQIFSRAVDAQKLLKQGTKRSFKNIDFKKIDPKLERLKEALVEVVNPLDNSDIDRINSEIKVLKDVEGFMVAPKFDRCTFEIIKKGEELTHFYYIIQEKQYQRLSELEMSTSFFKAEAIRQIFTILQIAFAIQTLHAKGYVHQDIRPENIMSTDAELTHVRLIDFSKAVKVGERGLEGTKLYYSPDKFKENFNASYHHDAYAFALTILFMYDFDYSFQTEMSSKYPSDLKAFPEDCKKLFTDKISKLKNEKYFLKNLLEYLEQHLFNDNTPLDISEMLRQLIEIYNNLVKGKKDIYPKETSLVSKIERIYTENIKGINKKKDDLVNKENLII